jgi:hypothetical protein
MTDNYGHADVCRGHIDGDRGSWFLIEEYPMMAL